MDPYPSELIAAPADHLALLLRRSLHDGSEWLSRLTGIDFPADCEPDLLRVRVGPRVPGVFDVAFTTAAWTDRSGNTVSWFAAGHQPHAFQGVVVLFCADSSTDEREHSAAVALDRLQRWSGTAVEPALLSA
ncbi:hypothetical protein SAMN05444157_1716 [Frankineae bacterium MT45]|nr:hypothetical protein SAMN05444157_1716 [Frankineae bacterium MT45]